MKDSSAWSEGRVARILARNTFKSDLVVVTNTVFTGFEADILVLTPSLRLVDVEIKVSRSDLKADANKSKWWHREWRRGTDVPDTRLDWPRSIWKHYYAMPAEIWKPEFIDLIANKTSGVILVHDHDNHVARDGTLRRRWMEYVSCARRAKPNNKAEPVGAATAVRLARLASLRTWDALAATEGLWRYQRGDHYTPEESPEGPQPSLQDCRLSVAHRQAVSSAFHTVLSRLPAD